MPKGQSVSKPRSRCPACAAEIGWRDNIPIASWLLLRGRCRACGEPISIEYPLLELATTIVVVGAALRYEDPWQAVLVAGLLCMMPAVTIIDIRYRIIPNRLMYPSLIVFPAYVVIGWLLGGPLFPISAALGLLAFGGGLLIIAVASRGMGLGDVKLAGVIGVALGALGLRYVGVAAAAAVVLGGLGGLMALALGKGRKSAIPFGPYLAAGAIVAAFWGENLAHWYLRTLGSG
jgi:leader peptidase (prepilin peptidase)/N-methyltransferase